MGGLGTIIRKDTAKWAYKLADFYKLFDVCPVTVRHYRATFKLDIWRPRYVVLLHL